MREFEPGRRLHRAPATAEVRQRQPESVLAPRGACHVAVHQRLVEVPPRWSPQVVLETGLRSCSTTPASHSRSRHHYAPLRDASFGHSYGLVKEAGELRVGKDAAIDIDAEAIRPF